MGKHRDKMEQALMLRGYWKARPSSGRLPVSGSL